MPSSFHIREPEWNQRIEFTHKNVSKFSSCAFLMFTILQNNHEYYYTCLLYMSIIHVYYNNGLALEYHFICITLFEYSTIIDLQYVSLQYCTSITRLHPTDIH